MVEPLFSKQAPIDRQRLVALTKSQSRLRKTKRAPKKKHSLAWVWVRVRATPNGDSECQMEFSQLDTSTVWGLLGAKPAEKGAAGVDYEIIESGPALELTKLDLEIWPVHRFN